MNITNVATISFFHGESYPAWFFHRIAKFVQARFSPRHIMPQYFKETLYIPGLTQHYFEGKLRPQLIQLLRLQLYPHNYCEIILWPIFSVNKTVCGVQDIQLKKWKVLDLEPK